MAESRTHELARALLKILANDHHGGFGDYPLSPAAFAAAKELHYQLPMLVESLPPWSGRYDCGRVDGDDGPLCEWPCKSCSPYTGIHLEGTT